MEALSHVMLADAQARSLTAGALGAALTGAAADCPRGCMVTLSAVGSEGHAALGELVRATRAVTLERLTERLGRAVDDGELPPSTDVHALARFVQTVQSGMSILARDGATAAELREVAQIAMLGWDARLRPGLGHPPEADGATA